MKTNSLKFIIIGATAALFLIGCKATTYSYAEYRTTDPSKSVVSTPVVADLSVSETRISYTAKIPTCIKRKTELEAKSIANKEKEIVIANALKANNADVLVAPIIDIQTDADYHLLITATGYPAVYKNFHNATKDEAWKLETTHSCKAEKKGGENPATKKKIPFLGK